MEDLKEVKFHSFETELAAMSKCFSHPARIMIIKILSKNKDRTCKEIVAELPLTQSTVSKHLKDLLDENLICRKLEGTQSIYTLQWNKLERLFSLYNRFSTKTLINRPKKNCC